MSLQGKVAIVTGAASGYGAETARLFAREGAMVVVADLNLAQAKLVASEIGSSALAIEVDASNRCDVERLVAACIAEFTVPDIVFNNASFTRCEQALLGMDEFTFDKIFSVNVKSVFQMANAVLPHMRRRGSGVILNLGSSVARPEPAGLCWFNDSRTVVSLMSQSLARETAKDGIRVHAICPLFGDRALSSHTNSAYEANGNHAHALANPGYVLASSAVDVARTALYLASAQAQTLTAVEYPVAGSRKAY